jgi:hypothetical protein
MPLLGDSLVTNKHAGAGWRKSREEHSAPALLQLPNPRNQKGEDERTRAFVRGGYAAESHLDMRTSNQCMRINNILRSFNFPYFAHYRPLPFLKFSLSFHSK